MLMRQDWEAGPHGAHDRAQFTHEGALRRVLVHACTTHVTLPTWSPGLVWSGRVRNYPTENHFWVFIFNFIMTSGEIFNFEGKGAISLACDNTFFLCLSLNAWIIESTASQVLVAGFELGSSDYPTDRSLHTASRADKTQHAEIYHVRRRDTK